MHSEHNCDLRQWPSLHSEHFKTIMFSRLMSQVVLSKLLPELELCPFLHMCSENMRMSATPFSLESKNLLQVLGQRIKWILISLIIWSLPHIELDLRVLYSIILVTYITVYSPIYVAFIITVFATLNIHLVLDPLMSALPGKFWVPLRVYWPALTCPASYTNTHMPTPCTTL